MEKTCEHGNVIDVPAGINCPHCMAASVPPIVTPQNIYNVVANVIWMKYKRHLGDNTAANQDEEAFRQTVAGVIKGVIADAGYILVPSSHQ